MSIFNYFRILFESITFKRLAPTLHLFSGYAIKIILQTVLYEFTKVIILSYTTIIVATAGYVDKKQPW